MDNAVGANVQAQLPTRFSDFPNQQFLAFPQQGFGAAQRPAEIQVGLDS